MAGNDSYTKLLLHCDGSDGGVSFSDASAGAHALSRHKSGLVTRTAQSKFGTASARSDDEISLLTAPHSSDFAPGNQNFAMDCQVYVTTSETIWLALLVHGINPMYHTTDTKWGWAWYLTSSYSTYYLRLYYSTTGSTRTNVSFTFNNVSSNAWHHLALWRYNNRLYAAVDGATSATSHDFNLTLYNPALPLQVLGYITNIDQDQASWQNGGNVAYGVYVDELRLSVGSSRWSDASFTPPAAAYSTPIDVTSTATGAAALSLVPGAAETAQGVTSRLSAAQAMTLTGLHPRSSTPVSAWLDGPASLMLTPQPASTSPTRAILDAAASLTLGGLPASASASRSATIEAAPPLVLTASPARTAWPVTGDLNLSCGCNLIESGLTLSCGLRGPVEAGLGLACALCSTVEAGLTLSCALLERTPVEASLGLCCALFELETEVIT